MLAWDEILSLQVVRKLSALISRRWGLGVALVRLDGGLVELPGAEYLRAGHGRCGKRDPTSDCSDSGSRALALLRNGGTAAGGGSAQTIACRGGGLHDVVVPLTEQGRLAGAVIAGGFIAGDDASASLPEGTCRLDAQEVDFLRALVDALAGEIHQWTSEHEAAARRILELETELSARASYGGLIGKSRPMQDLYGLIDKVAATDATVLVMGENGTGKELVARAIHQKSPRATNAFVAANCSAFNDNLLDSELFGHKRGSFTGAVVDKEGLFGVADQGTFFLDEIGDMTPALQVKLLRVLQEGTFLPVGGTEAVQVDVRILAASNRDLKRMVEKGEFREDLYYRVHVITLKVPALRERREDIPMLVDHFLARHARAQRRHKRLSAACMQRLLDSPWPGNVRELENEVERLWVLSGDAEMVPEELLSARLRETAATTTAGEPPPPLGALGPTASTLPDALAALERAMIRERLERAGGNKTRAARELGISRRNLIRKVHEYGLDSTPAKAPPGEGGGAGASGGGQAPPQRARGVRAEAPPGEGGGGGRVP